MAMIPFIKVFTRINFVFVCIALCAAIDVSAETVQFEFEFEGELVDPIGNYAAGTDFFGTFRYQSPQTGIPFESSSPGSSVYLYRSDYFEVGIGSDIISDGGYYRGITVASPSGSLPGVFNVNTPEYFDEIPPPTNWVISEQQIYGFSLVLYSEINAPLTSTLLPENANFFDELEHREIWFWIGDSEGYYRERADGELTSLTLKRISTVSVPTISLPVAVLLVVFLILAVRTQPGEKPFSILLS